MNREEVMKVLEAMIKLNTELERLAATDSRSLEAIMLNDAKKGLDLAQIFVVQTLHAIGYKEGGF